MSNIKCEVARDLMPLMADDVASPGSVELVNEHMEGCETCKAYYAGMKVMLPKSRKDEDDNSFVQFVKKEKKGFRNRKWMIRALIALLMAVIVFVGCIVVNDQMNLMIPMNISNTDVELFCNERGYIGVVVQMKNGQGWYDSFSGQFVGDVLFLQPYAPSLRLWNRGETGVAVSIVGCDLHMENGRIVRKIQECDVVYDEEKGEYVDEWTEHMSPVSMIRWGSLDNFVTIYETGDAVPFMNYPGNMVVSPTNASDVEGIEVSEVRPASEPKTTWMAESTPNPTSLSTPEPTA